MSYLHQIVYLRPLAYPSPPKSGSVNGRIRPDFDVVIHLNGPNLGDFHMLTTLEFKSEAVTTQDDATVQDHPISDFAAKPDRHAWMDKAVATDLGSVTDVAMRTNDSTGANRCTVLNDCIWLNTDVRPELHTASNDDRRMHSRWKTNRRRGEPRCHF